MPNIVSLEVMCGKDHMDVHLSFSHPFEGIVSSKGKISMNYNFHSHFEFSIVILFPFFMIQFIKVNIVTQDVFMCHHQLEKNLLHFE